MLLPRRVKHRKVMRGRMSGQAKGGHYVAFGDYGLATLEPAWITSRQIEAARRAMTRSVKRGGKIWIRVFPDKPVTKKPAETRMGSGKGAPDHWVAVARRHEGRRPRGRGRGRRALMAIMEITKIREMSDNELADALRQAKQDLWSARFSLSTRQLNDTSTIPQTRRAIARILTVQRERGISGFAPAAPKSA